MITEDYVSFETAKSLMKAGFNIITRTSYDGCGVVNKRGCGSTSDVFRPTIQLVVKWFERIHNIIIVVDYEYEFDETPYYFKIYALDENGKPQKHPILASALYPNCKREEMVCCGYRDFDTNGKMYSSRKKAYEEAFEYCLRNYI